ncbi:hypothetical protein B7463_g11247, partial [Scytalidium lignicola]
MKLPFVLLTGLAFLSNVILAQDLSSALTGLPPCTNPCIQQVVAKYNCSSSSCICTSAAFQKDLLLCVDNTCSAADQLLAAGLGSTIGSTMCAGVQIPSRGREMRNDVVILAAVTYPIITLRYYQRLTIARQAWLDDWMALATTILLGAFDGIAIASTYKGFGDHIWGIPMENMVPLLKCTPVKAVWDRSIEGKCISLEAFGYAAAAASILEDLVILVLPVSELKNLNLGTKKKIALMFMFSIGSFACVTSIIRLKYVGKIARSLDSTWDNVDPVLWSIIEVHTALICACLPSLKSLLTKYFPVLFKSTLASSSKNRNTGTVSQKVFSKHHSRRRQSDSYLWLPESSGASTNNISAGGAAALGVVGDEEKDIPLRVIETDGREDRRSNRTEE